MLEGLIGVYILENNIVQLFLESESSFGYRSRVEVYIIKDNRILIGSGKSRAGDTYVTIPGGGIDEGESIEDAAYRETLEEVGVQIKNIKSIYKASVHQWNPSDTLPAKWGWVTKHPLGSITYYRMAEFDEYNDSLYGTEPDMYKLKEVSINEAIELWKIKLKKGNDEKWLTHQWHHQLKVLLSLSDELIRK